MIPQPPQPLRATLFLTALVSLVLASPAARCDTTGAAPVDGSRLTLDLAGALRDGPDTAAVPAWRGLAGQPGDQPAKGDENGAKVLDVPRSAEHPVPEHPRFGTAGTEWLTIGLGDSNDFHQDHGAEVHGSFSRFLDDDLEFAVELSGWYFAQRGHDTEGLNPTMNLRWHLWHAEDYDWSVYGEIGIGLLFAFDNVPDSGTGFNFTPRAGMGITKAIFDDDARLQVGVRWAHISNGRIEGAERNPGRDSVMIYAGVIFPFP